MLLRLAPALVLLLAARGGLAAPIASQARDIDGDGAPEVLELASSGELSIESASGTSRVAIGGGIKRAKLSAAVVRGTPMIVVTTDQEAIVVAKTRAGYKVLVRTPAGGVGLDADYGVDVVALPEGLFRYQSRAGYRRCDDKPALLFGERYEAGRFQRLARLPIAMPDTAQVIAARLDTPEAPEPLTYKARFASHQPGATDAGALSIPSELDDGKPATVWREELAASAGEGQFFTYLPRFDGAKAAQVRLVASTSKGANRPQRLGVVSKDAAYHIDFPDPAKDPPGSAYVADLPAPVDGCVTIVIESTYGPARGTTSIAELAVFAEGERAGGGEAALAKVVAEGADGAKAAAQALARRGAAAVAALDAELAKATRADARRRLVQAAIAIRDPAVAPLLARIALQGEARGADLVDTIAALGEWKLGQELHDLAASGKVPLEARVAAVRALAPATDKDRELLVDLAGDGPRELRQAVIQRLTDVPVPVLVAAAQTHADPSGAGDLWRAVTRRAHARPDERAAALAAMTAALPTATDYERRYRLADGIAAIGDAPALSALTAWLRTLPADARTAAYKQVAARAIGVNPRNEATELLVSFARDADPGVRLAALSAIAGATGTSAGPWHGDAGPDGIDRVIMTLLASDTWPEVRRTAAQVLGGRCARPGPAQALADAVARDADIAVRGDALGGLVDCKAHGVAALLAKLWDDSKTPLEVRRRAVDLTMQLDDRALAAKLVGRFNAWRGAAIESAAALALAQNAAYVIGSMNPPGAVAALVAALDDAAFPEIVAAAATGLGLLGPSCTPAAKQKLLRLRHSEERQIQIAARRAAALCGKR